MTDNAAGGGASISQGGAQGAGCAVKSSSNPRIAAHFDATGKLSGVRMVWMHLKAGLMFRPAQDRPATGESAQLTMTSMASTPAECHRRPWP